MRTNHFLKSSLPLPELKASSHWVMGVAWAGPDLIQGWARALGYESDHHDRVLLEGEGTPPLSQEEGGVRYPVQQIEGSL